MTRALPWLAALALILLTACRDAGAQDQQRPAVPTSLAPNAGCEDGDGEPDGWSFYSWEGAEGWWDEAVARSGGRSLGMKGINGGWSCNFPVAADAIYSLKFHSRSEDGPSQVVIFVREIVDGEIGEVIVYKPVPPPRGDATGRFVDGVYVDGAGEGGWVEIDGGAFSPGESIEELNLLIKVRGEAADAQVWLDDVVITELESREPPRTARMLAALDECAVWTDSENRKMLPEDEPPGGDTLDAIEIAAARGEYECFQIAVTPKTAMTAVDWERGEFAAEMRCRLIECIPITRTRSPYEHEGLNPDALTDRMPADIAAGTTQGFWFTVRVPEDLSAGEYGTELTLRAGGEEVARVPVKLTVWDFTMPPRPSLGVYSHFRSEIALDREVGERDDIVGRYYRTYFEHRSRCNPAARIGVRLDGDTAELDADEYVANVKYMRDEHGLDRYGLYALWIGHRGTHRMPADATWRGRQIFANADLTELDPAFEHPFRDYLAKLCGRLREEGVLLRPNVKFFDEPQLTDQATVNGLKTLSELILDIEPEITVALAASDPHPELIGVIKEWVLHTDAWDRVLPNIEAAREAGCEIHVYNNAVNWPSQRRMRVRLWPWMLYEYGVDGTYSWWGTVCWRGDMADPWTVGQGEFSGILLYPPRSDDERGPIDSVRWELFREGLEDYEYIRMASEAGADDVVSAAMELVDRWPNVRAGNDEPYEVDPRKLDQVRDMLAEAIVGA